MPNTKTTLEDVLFHIKRLTEALDGFTEQMKDEKLVYVEAPPISKQLHISKYDVMVQDQLKLMAQLMSKFPDSDVKRKLLNPSPTEIAKMKYDFRLQAKKEREEKKEERASKEKK